MWLVKTKRSPYWQARWSHPDGGGRVISFSTGEEGRRAAETRAAQLRADHKLKWEREKSGGNLSATAVIADYWETEASRRKSGKGHIFPHLERIAHFLGDRTYCDITIADVAAFVDSMDKTVSDSTINRAVSIWRRLHNVAMKRRGLPVRPIDWSQVRRDEPVPVARNIHPETLKRILSGLPPRAREIALFALATGARRSQVLTLTWDRVDLELGVATVWKKHRKAQAPQRLVLHDTAIGVLSHIRDRELADGNLVFDTTNFRKHWDKAVADADAEGVRFHDLRHTFATIMSRKASINLVQEQLGHSSPLLTARYAHVQGRDVRAAIEQISFVDVIGDADQGDT